MPDSSHEPGAAVRSNRVRGAEDGAVRRGIAGSAEVLQPGRASEGGGAEANASGGGDHTAAGGGQELRGDCGDTGTPGWHRGWAGGEPGGVRASQVGYAVDG